MAVGYRRVVALKREFDGGGVAPRPEWRWPETADGGASIVRKPQLLLAGFPQSGRDLCARLDPIARIPANGRRARRGALHRAAPLGTKASPALRYSRPGVGANSVASGEIGRGADRLFPESRRRVLAVRRALEGIRNAVYRGGADGGNRGVILLHAGSASSTGSETGSGAVTIPGQPVTPSRARTRRSRRSSAPARTEDDTPMDTSADDPIARVIAPARGHPTESPPESVIGGAGRRGEIYIPAASPGNPVWERDPLSRAASDVGAWTPAAGVGVGERRPKKVPSGWQATGSSCRRQKPGKMATRGIHRAAPE